MSMNIIPSIKDIDTSLMGDGCFSVIPLKPAGVVQGTWTASMEIASQWWIGHKLSNDTSHANGDECYFYAMLAPGTYTFQLATFKASPSGILKVYLDSTLIATFDLYSAVSTLTILEQTAIAITTGKLYKLSFKIDGKNGASTNYYCGISTFSWIKTA